MVNRVPARRNDPSMHNFIERPDWGFPNPENRGPEGWVDWAWVVFFVVMGLVLVWRTF
jgi:hypothetical protein